MRTGKRFSAAAIVACVMASGMMLGSARLEAKGGKGGGGGGNAICDALLAVITYKYVSPAIKDYATGLYLAYGCDPSLLP